MTTLRRSLITELDQPECLALLRRHQHGVGRIGIGGDDPIVLPVNYVLDHGDIVVQTGEGTIRAAADAGQRVAFEIDSIPSPFVGGTAGGWSVLARGTAEVVEAPSERTYLQLGRLQPSAGGFKPHFVRIAISELTGRRF
jgi:uncharacterized protein